MIAVSKGETIEHYVSRRISGVPGGACSAALSKRSSCAARWRQWPPGRVSFRPGWANAGGLCLSTSRCGRHTDRRAALGAVRARQGIAGNLQHDVPPLLQRRAAGSRRRSNGPPAARGGPVPSCTAFLDQLDGAAEHATQRVNFVVVAKSPLQRILTFAKERGWRRLRLLSSAGNSYNRDYLGETPDGHQMPMLNVFNRDGETIRHCWGSELLYAPTDPGQDPRHNGTLEPLWNLFDLAPEGRPTDWDEQLSYPDSQEQSAGHS